jgi:hypothetical protein
MRVRFSIDDEGELVDRDGHVLTWSLLNLSRVVSLTLETTKSDGTTGGFFKASELQKVERKENPSGPSAISQEVAEVWAHYDALIGKGRRKLRTAQTRDIQRALDVCGIQVVKDAISGLANSPHHNGQNDTGAKYLDIRYALRGNSQRGETPEERIERMAQLANSPMAAETTTRDRGVAEGWIAQLKTDVRRCWLRDPRDPQPTEEQLTRRDEAIQELYGYGIMVRLGENGQPSYEDIA